MMNVLKVLGGIILIVICVFRFTNFFTDISDEPIAYTRASAAFMGSLGIQFDDPVAEQLRTEIVSNCPVVPYKKLAAAAVNELISQTVNLVGLRGLTAEIVAEIISQSAKANPDSVEEVKCLSSLTLMRRVYPKLWDLVEASSAGDHDLADIAKIIDKASKP